MKRYFDKFKRKCIVNFTIPVNMNAQIAREAEREYRIRTIRFNREFIN